METPSQALKPKHGEYDKERYRRKRAAMTPEQKQAFNTERKQYMKKWRDNNRSLHRSYGVNFRKKKIALMNEDELKIFREQERNKTKKLNNALKEEVFSYYGGWKCACCGETEKSFLTIDHMENNGSKLRREGIHGHSTQFYRWLKKSGFPPEFQVLCMNCNFGKRMNNGICPHQVKV